MARANPSAAPPPGTRPAANGIALRASRPSLSFLRRFGTLKLNGSPDIAEYSRMNATVRTLLGPGIGPRDARETARARAPHVPGRAHGGGLAVSNARRLPRIHTRLRRERAPHPLPDFLVHRDLLRLVGAELRLVLEDLRCEGVELLARDCVSITEQFHGNKHTTRVKGTFVQYVDMDLLPVSPASAGPTGP